MDQGHQQRAIGPVVGRSRTAPVSHEAYTLTRSLAHSLVPCSLARYSLGLVQNTAPTVQLHVKGMMCARCAEQVKRTIEKTKARQRAVLGLMDWHTRLTGGYIVQSVTDVTLDHEEQLVTITGKVEIAEILGRLEEAGFIPSIV